MVLHSVADNMIAPMLREGGGLGQSGETLRADDDPRMLLSLLHSLEDGSVGGTQDYRVTENPVNISDRAGQCHRVRR